MCSRGDDEESDSLGGFHETFGPGFGNDDDFGTRHRGGTSATCRRRRRSAGMGVSGKSGLPMISPCPKRGRSKHVPGAAGPRRVRRPSMGSGSSNLPTRRAPHDARCRGARQKTIRAWMRLLPSAQRSGPPRKRQHCRTSRRLHRCVPSEKATERVRNRKWGLPRR